MGKTLSMYFELSHWRALYRRERPFQGCRRPFQGFDVYTALMMENSIGLDICDDVFKTAAEVQFMEADVY